MKSLILSSGRGKCARWVVVLLLMLFVSSFTFAEQPAGNPPVAPTESGQATGDVKITADWKDNPLRQVLQYITERAGVNIIPDISINDDVRVKMSPITNLPWRQALEEVCRLTGCILEEVTPTIFHVTKPPTYTKRYEDANLEVIVREIAEEAGVNIIIDNEVKGKKVSFSFENVPWIDALNYLAKTAGFTVVKEERNVYRIVKPQSIAAQMETRVFQLKYLRPPADYRAAITLPKTQAVGTPKEPKGVEDFTLLVIVKGMLSPASGINPAGSLQYDEKTSSIIIRDTKPVLDEIQKLLDKLDVEPLQIMFNVYFVNTQNKDLLNFGISYGGGGKDGILVTSTPRGFPVITEGTTTSRAARQTRSPFGMGPDYPNGTNFDLAFLTTFDLTATLRLFKGDATSKLEQRPSILTLDGMEATIAVTEQIHYPETTATAAAGGTGGLTYSIAEASKSPVEYGFQLLVIPHIVKGTNKVMLTMIPQDKALTGKSFISNPTTLEGFEHFEIDTGAAVGAKQTIDLPRYRNSTLVTHLIIESGQTAVVGGLSTDRIDHSLKRVPFFSEIPLIGAAFRSTDDDVSKDHLLIFITPTIIRNAQESLDVLKGPIKTIEEEGKALEKKKK